LTNVSSESDRFCLRVCPVYYNRTGRGDATYWRQILERPATQTLRAIREWVGARQARYETRQEIRSGKNPYVISVLTVGRHLRWSKGLGGLETIVKYLSSKQKPFDDNHLVT